MAAEKKQRQLNNLIGEILWGKKGVKMRKEKSEQWRQWAYVNRGKRER